MTNMLEISIFTKGKSLFTYTQILKEVGIKGTPYGALI